MLKGMLKGFWNHCHIVTACCLMLLLAACGSTVKPVPPPYVLNDEYQQRRIAYLERKEVSVLRLGEYRTIVIPMEDFEPSASHRINPENRPVLDAIVQLINSDRKVAVTVGVHPPAQKRAEKIAHYLWERGIDARLLETLPKHSRVEGMDDDPRIEINYQILREDV